MADRVALIRGKAASIAESTSDHFTERDRQWARRIVEWAAAQAGPQQLGFDL